MTDFAHLHVHTQASLLDSIIRSPELITHLKEIGISACAITDHGVMSGVIEFYKCSTNSKDGTKGGIKPLLGVEAYLTTDQDTFDPKANKIRDNHHLVLIAKNKVGYVELLELVSEAALNNFYYKPRINIDKLFRLAGNVFVTTACLGGVLTAHSKWDGKSFTKDSTDQTLRFLCSLAGKENVFLELQDWDDGSGKQPAWNNFLLDLSQEHCMDTVITTDAHFLKEQDFEIHELTMAMQLKKNLTQYREDNVLRYGPSFWIKPPEMMLASAKKIGCEASFWNTGKIADLCEPIKIEFGLDRNPVYVPSDSDDYKEFLLWRRQHTC